MNLFICGQKSFGAAIVKRLHQDGHSIVGVAPPPQEKYYDKIQVAAVKLGLPCVSDCDKLTSRDIPNETDLIIAAHSHWYISGKVLAKTRYGGIGFHPSLLPLHRGRDAVRWAVAMGDKVTGATVYWLDDRVDGGDILSQRTVFIARCWDYHKLWAEMFPIGVDMISEAVRMIGKGKAPRNPQDERFATWEPAFDSTRRLYRPELPMLGGG